MILNYYQFVSQMFFLITKAIRNVLIPPKNITLALITALWNWVGREWPSSITYENLLKVHVPHHGLMIFLKCKVLLKIFQ